VGPEVISLQSLAGACYLLPLFRHFSKRLSEIPGVLTLPWLGLFISATLIPAYGFRLSFLPFAFYGILSSLWNLIVFRAMLKSRRTSFEFPATIILFVLLGLALGLSIFQA
jgi:hypothetical protein